MPDGVGVAGEGDPPALAGDSGSGRYPMRVAIIAEVFLPKIDGVVNRTLNLIRELQRAGDDVLVVCPQAEGARTGPTPVVEFRSFPFPLYPEYRIARPDPRLVETLEEFR